MNRGTLSIIAATVFLLLPAAAGATLTINYASSPKIYGIQLDSSIVGAAFDDFTISMNASSTVLSGSFTGMTTTNDVVTDNFTSAHILNGCDVVPQFSFDATPLFTAATPSIAGITSDGIARYASDGTALFNVKVNSRTRQVSCVMSNLSAQTTSSFSGFAAGSLAASMYSTVTNAINGKTPDNGGANDSIYSSLSINLPAIIVVRNHSSTFIASTTDLTSIPVANDVSGQRFNGILVTPDIVIMAAHTGAPNTMYFANDTISGGHDTIYSANVVGSQKVGTDILVVRLDHQLPSDITPAKVFQSNTFTNKITSNALSQYKLQLFYTNQFRTIRVTQFCSSVITSDTICVLGQNPTTWYQVPINGDSGSPAFAIVNGQTAAVGTWYAPWIISNISNQVSAINSAITALGSATTLQTVDLSGFSTY